MARTNDALVKAALGPNYDSVVNPSLAVFISPATLIAERIKACAIRKGISPPLSDLELREIETWLACHFYAHADPLYQSRSTAGASGNFQVGTPASDLETTNYGKAALNIDWSGCLKNLSRQQRAGGQWLGTTDNVQGVGITGSISSLPFWWPSWLC